MEPSLRANRFQGKRPLKRKDNSSRAPCRRLRARLCCHAVSTSWCGNINPLPFRRGLGGGSPQVTNHTHDSTELPCALGSTNPCPNAVHMEPCSTSVLSGRMTVFATTTKICTAARFSPAYAATCVTEPHALLLPGASHLPRGPRLGGSLQRHPFSGLVHSAGELLHTP